MKKIVLYNVTEEQKPFVEIWSKKNNVEVKMLPCALCMETVEEAKGCHGVTVSHRGDFDSNLYPILRSYGIRNVAQRSAGYEIFDLELASQNDIIVTNVAAYSPESIAEFALYMALRIVRKGQEIQNQVEKKDFRWIPQIRGKVLREMTVGVFGTGRIGMEVAKLFKSFGCRVLAYDLCPSCEHDDILEYRDTPEDIVKEADLISLHMPSTKDNFHLFNAEMFKKFKPGSYILNAGRGQLINTKDLIDALDSGILAGAALDTYENEAGFIPADFSNKEIDDELFKKVLSHPKIDFTHHVAYYTETAIQNMLWFALDSTLEIIEKGTTQNRVN